MTHPPDFERQTAPEGAVHPLLERAAGRILDDRAAGLPDLSAVVVLMPQLRPAAALREALMHESRRRGHPSLLLPRTVELRVFVADHAQATDRPTTGGYQRLLMLVNALRRHRRLFGRGSPWLLAENLLQLFDELSGYHIHLPDTPEAFARTLAEAYRLPADHPALMREAQLVQTLWRAWRDQLAAEGRVDPVHRYLEQLNDSLNRLPPNTPLYALGFGRCIPAERQWLQTAVRQGRLTWFDRDEQPSPDRSRLTERPDTRDRDAPFADFLDACYGSGDAPLNRRIEDFRNRRGDSPVRGRLHVLGLNQLEQHAEAVTLYVRAALANGAGQVGIVTEDRRLARRLRALLERSGITLQDTVGWALSTTAAAATLENWLECVEQDFPHRAFLDLLKSPFHLNPRDRETLRLIYRFEHDIVIHENIGSGIDRYRRAVKSRAARLKWGKAAREDLLDLLSRFEQAALSLPHRQPKAPDAADLLGRTIQSLRELNIDTAMRRDAAGEQLFDVLTALHDAAREQPTRLDWTEYRGWLSAALEQTYFRPPAPPQRSVQLLNLQQADLLTFDALVIAAADEQHLPGDPARLPFFNDAVRASLGLPDWRHRLRERERLFRELLQAAPAALITWQQERNGEPVAASPWVAAPADFHEQVYGDRLEPAALKQWVQLADPVPVIRDETVPPELAARPAPSVSADALPARLTVSAHQRLIDCPYRFYVYDVLQLKALDEVREALQKSDYGSRVHECLEAFHVGKKNRPGPLSRTLTADHREEALALLERISREVFAEDTENNFQHRGWLQRWLAFIPQYIDWQIGREARWRIRAGERKTEAPVTPDLALYGRIDRIDEHNGRLSLIDYKTGAVPRPADVRSGEDVQLVSYSLLMEHVDSVLYLGLDGRGGVDDKTELDAEELASLRASVRDRLCDLMQRIRNGAPMPAIGDEATCRHCDAAGICRRKAWQPF